MIPDSRGSGKHKIFLSSVAIFEYDVVYRSMQAELIARFLKRDFSATRSLFNAGSMKMA